MQNQMTKSAGHVAKYLTIIGIAIVSVFAPSSAFAAGNCFFLTSPTSMAFSTYSPFSTSWLDTSMSFSIRCTPNTTGRIILSTGNAGSYSPRSMSSGTAGLAYNLYTDASASVVWGDGTAGTTDYQTVNPGQGNMDFVVSVYGRISAGMDVPAGLYSDTIVVELQADGVTKDTASFAVTTRVISSCTVDSFTLNFGSYDPVSTNRTTPLNATTSIVAYCTKDTSATISLSDGLNPSGGMRRMSGPLGEFLTYDVYLDSGHSNIWNSVNTVSATSTSKTVPLGGPAGVPGYGQVPAAQNVRPGSYTDTVVATVNY